MTASRSQLYKAFMRRYPITRCHSASFHGHRAGGFTYLGLLIVIALIGLASTAALQVGVILQRRAAEEDLLAIGTEFRNALVSYANATPPGQKRFPASLQDLLKDPRYPNVRRHLRKLYVDPITGKAGWGTVMAPDGSGIIGVYSLSTAPPIKIGNFDLTFQGFDGKTSYREWKFIATP
jgi:type II secretory pathway pseudopilin PulG